MKKTSNKACDARDELQHVICKLYNLAEAAGLLGLKELDIKLRHCTSQTQFLTAELFQAYTDEVNRSVRVAGESSANILKATLAGVELGQKGD